MNPTETLPVRVLCGLSDPREAALARPLPPFDPRVTAFLNDLSEAMLANTQVKRYADAVTFAFFCRRANLTALAKPYGEFTDQLGRGLVFHIAPGNVPMNFAYSLVAALLAGNASIVKASSQGFEQVELTCAAMEKLLSGAHAALKPYVNVISYPREQQDVTEALSALCDARVIWGGDETIRRVREAPLSPRAFDVTFADRWSVLAADAQAVTELDDRALNAAAQGFYNDTYLLHQNACTAPRLVYWLGEGASLASARERFWRAVWAYAKPRYAIDPETAVDKLAMLYRAAIELPGARLAPMPDNLVVRIQLDELTPEVTLFHVSGGCFLEYASPSLQPLLTLATAKTQTLSALGLSTQTLRDLALTRGVRGIDRVVPLGHTLDFSLVWDGYDLIATLSRRIAAM
jgi:hypothetical protein